ncbi:VENN motif pre-toxin domain-containing protein [Snodgrassella gandavensis]|uniref:VENN motif pre-toxin domain-containing protein n=1 Tax=Snodgrassella gandavensis TaxID=2946698 RepID=UPI001EF4432A|nr:VENN motif pre-toxin domain-containing protein [Snodgrassella gandavensis]
MQATSAFINSKKDKLKEELKKENLSPEERAQYEKELAQWSTGGLILNAIGAGLAAPTNNIGGIIAATASPVISHQIGQYFKVLAHKNQITGGKDELTAGQEAAHILAHAILGAAVAAAGGNDALAGGLAAAGVEATTPILSQWLYGKNPADLTADEKATVSAIAGLAGAATGVAVGGSMADVAQGDQAGHIAVDNNTVFGDKIRSYIEDAKHYWHTEKEAKDNLDVIRNVAVNLIGDGLDSVVGLSDYGIDSLNALVYCTGITPNLCNQMQATLDPKNKAALDSIKSAFDTRTYIQFYELLDKAAHGDLQAREAAGELLAAVLITKKVSLNVGKVSKAGKNAEKGVAGTDKSSAQKRPTPKDSEKDVGTSLPPDYKPQVSYKDGKEVPYGTKGSTRPDWCNRTTCSIEVKNYDIGKYADNLINNVSKQAIDRSKHLPNGMQQQVRIDVRGQHLTPAMESKIRRGIVQKSNGIISSKQIKFINE